MKATQEEIQKKIEAANQSRQEALEWSQRRKQFVQARREESAAAGAPLHYLHLRETERVITKTGEVTIQPIHFGGATICYSMPKERGGTVVEVATALCNPCDCYSKGLGIFESTRNFAEGHTVKIRIPTTTLEMDEEENWIEVPISVDGALREIFGMMAL